MAALTCELELRKNRLTMWLMLRMVRWGRLRLANWLLGRTFRYRIVTIGADRTLGSWQRIDGITIVRKDRSLELVADGQTATTVCHR